jgi:hypothetical protein
VLRLVYDIEIQPQSDLQRRFDELEKHADAMAKRLDYELQGQSNPTLDCLVICDELEAFNRFSATLNAIKNNNYDKIDKIIKQEACIITKDTLERK